MDNRFNEIRRKISALRAEMLAAEKSVRDLVNRDLDCTDLSFRLMAMRADLAALIRRWREAGGGDELTAVAEGLKHGASRESRKTCKHPADARFT
jgi:hypothetical protein